jgi:hypothetical protein
MLSISLPEYMQRLREQRIWTSKQSLFLEYVNLYTDNARVYKIILSCNPDQLKRAAKVGIKARFTIIHHNIPQIPIQSPPNFDISRGKYFLQYSFRTTMINIYRGEDNFLNKIGHNAKNKSHSQLRNRIAGREQLRSNSDVFRDTTNNVQETNNNSPHDIVHDSSSKPE